MGCRGAPDASEHSAETRPRPPLSPGERQDFSTAQPKEIECPFQPQQTKRSLATDQSTPQERKHANILRPVRLVDLLRLPDVHLLLDLVDVDAGNVGVVAVDNLGKLLEGRAFGLDVHEVHKDELDKDPALGATRLAGEPGAMRAGDQNSRYR